MSTESVKYIIDAEDNATVAFANVRAEMQKSVVQVKEFSGKTKTSVELAGALATAVGGTQFASFAGDIAGLTGKVSQFSDVMKQGGSGVLAFKVGVIAAAGAITYNAVSATAAWIVGLEETKKKLADIQGELSRTSNVFSNELKKTLDLRSQLVESPAEKDKFYFEMVTNVERLGGELANITRQKDALQGQFMAGWMPGDDLEKRLDSLTQIENSLRGELDVYKQQKRAIEEKESALVKAVERKKTDDYIEKLREELQMTRAVGDEKLKLEAMQQTTDSAQQQQIFELLKAKKDYEESVKAIAEADKQRIEDQRVAEREAEQQRKKEIADRQKIVEQQRSALDNMRRQIAVAKDGEKAGQVMDLMAKGFSETAASQLAGLQAEFDSLLNQKATKVSATVNNAQESRLQTGVRGLDQAGVERQRQLELQAKLNELTERMTKSLDSIDKSLKEPEEVIGA